MWKWLWLKRLSCKFQYDPIRLPGFVNIFNNLIIYSESVSMFTKQHCKKENALAQKEKHD